MESSYVMYSRHFSNIAHLQTEETVFYNLHETHCAGSGFYGIELVSQPADAKEHQKVCLDALSNSREDTLDILKFLHENAVKPEASVGIISDILESRLHGITSI